MILIVNDDALACSQLADALRAAGHRDFECCNVTQAYQQAVSSRPGLIVIVVRHRGTGGIVLAASLRIGDQTSMIPIIVMSPHEEHRRLQAMLARFGVRALLGEPFGPSDVIALIDLALGPNARPGQIPLPQAPPAAGEQTGWRASLAMNDTESGE